MASEGVADLAVPTVSGGTASEAAAPESLGFETGCMDGATVAATGEVAATPGVQATAVPPLMVATVAATGEVAAKGDEAKVEKAPDTEAASPAVEGEVAATPGVPAKSDVATDAAASPAAGTHRPRLRERINIDRSGTGGASAGRDVSGMTGIFEFPGQADISCKPCGGVERSEEGKNAKGKNKKEKPPPKPKQCGVDQCLDMSLDSFPHCGRHNRAKQCIHTDTFSGSKKGVVPPDKQKLQEEYLKIFGDKKKGYKPNNKKISEVLDAFCVEFPEEDRALGTKRGETGWLNTWAIKSGNRKSDADIGACPYLDWDLYYTKVTAARPRWTEQEKVAVWKEASQTTKPDHKKHTPSGQERLPIPGWVLGDDRLERKDENYTDQGNDQSSNVTPEEANRRLEELPKVAGAAPSFQQVAPGALISGAFVPGAPSPTGVPPAAPQSVSPQKLVGDAPAIRRASDLLAGEPHEVEERAEKEVPKRRRVDIGVKRSQVLTAEKKLLDSTRKKLLKGIDDTAVELQIEVDGKMDQKQGGFLMTEARMSCALMWLGCKFADAAGTEPGSTIRKFKRDDSNAALKVDVDFEALRDLMTPGEKQMFALDAALNDKLLQGELRKLEVKPVIPEKCRSFLSMLEICETICSAQTEEAIELKRRELENLRSLMAEFSESLVDAKNVTKTAFKVVLALREADQRNEQELKHQTFERVNREALESLRKKKSRLNVAGLFEFNWAAYHPTVPVYRGTAALSEAWKVKVVELLTFPYVAVLEEAKDIITRDPVAKTLINYLKVYPTMPFCVENDRIASPMTHGHGGGELKPIWSLATPSEHILKDQLARLSSVALKPWLFGYTQNAVHMGFEPELLGTIKIFTTGKAKLLMVSGTDLSMSKIGTTTADNADLSDIVAKHFLGLRDEEAVEKLKELGVVIVL
jgi:hypothetical protein